MKAENLSIIFDPYLVIPSYGENRVNLSYSNLELEVTIFYDAQIGDDEKTLRFLFEHTCFHKFTSFPGVSDSVIEFENYDEISSLIEFKHSDYKTLWENQFKNLFKFRHFTIFFTSANHYLEVVCENVSIIS